MNNIPIYASILFAGAFIFTLFLMPKIRGVVNYKNLYDNPNGRSSHKKPVPSLGGIAFFISLMIGYFFIAPFDDNKELLPLIPGLSILLITGLKDDLMVLGPWTKLLSQIAASGFVIFNYKFNQISLHGFMGIESMPLWLSGLLTVFIIITVINSFNLIDGIDGLASSLGITILSGFSLLFYLNEEFPFMLICIVFTGTLLAFLMFNLSVKYKIFMGDTGSLILGFVAGIMAIKALAMNPTSSASFPFPKENIPFIIIGLLFVPLFDTGRVFLIRLLSGKSPFKPDRNHVHHIIIDFFNISHRRTSFFLAMSNLIIFLGFTGLATQINQWFMLIIFIATIGLGLLIFHLLKQKITINPKSN